MDAVKGDCKTVGYVAQIGKFDVGTHAHSCYPHCHSVITFDNKPSSSEVYYDICKKASAFLKCALSIQIFMLPAPFLAMFENRLHSFQTCQSGLFHQELKQNRKIIKL